MKRIEFTAVLTGIDTRGNVTFSRNEGTENEQCHTISNIRGSDLNGLTIGTQYCLVIEEQHGD